MIEQQLTRVGNLDAEIQEMKNGLEDTLEAQLKRLDDRLMQACPEIDAMLTDGVLMHEAEDFLERCHQAPQYFVHDPDTAWQEAENEDLAELAFYETDFEKGLEEMTNAQLGAACRGLDLPTKGSRSLLINRLVKAAIRQVERRRKNRQANRSGVCV